MATDVKQLGAYSKHAHTVFIRLDLFRNANNHPDSDQSQQVRLV